MSETVLDYDKIIWEVFAIGITASIVILYNVIHLENKIPENFDVLALILGFSILIYSFILFLGYNFKKDKLIECFNDKSLEKDYKLENELSEKLHKSFYPRTKWMAEIILLFIIILYFKAFSKNWPIPIIILSIAVLLCYIANCCAKRKDGKKEKWRGFITYLKEYFCIN